MESYLNQYSLYSNTNGIEYNTISNVTPISYSNYGVYNSYTPMSYSNNVDNNYINNLTPYSDISSPTSFNTFETSNNFNTNNGTYSSSSIKILPPIYIPDKITNPTININYSNNYLNSNNYINNNYQQTSYQNISYIDDTDNNLNSHLEYNNIQHPLDTFLSKNILEMTASSSNTLDFGTTITPISYNNSFNEMEDNNYAYTPEFDRQNNVLFKSFEPIRNNNKNTNLISDLRNSYFNASETPYSVFSYNPTQIRDSLNYSSLSNDFLNNSMYMQPRYGVSSVPISNNFQNAPQIHTEIVPIEEIELIPVKKIKYVKRTTIKYPIKKSSIKQPVIRKSSIKTPVIRRSLINSPEARKSYYIPKDKIPSRYNNIQVSSRPLSPIRNIRRLEPLSPSSSYMGDYPHDNYAGAGIYSPRVYRINLNEKKRRRKNFY